MKVFLYLLGIILSASANASFDLPISGRVFTDQYLHTESGEVAQSSLSVWLDADKKINDSFGIRGIGEFDAFAKNLDHSNSSNIFVQLREGYASYLADGIDLRIGQQIIPWGKSDGVNPTDYFTAKKYTFLNPDDEVRRIGAPALNLSYTPDEGKSPFTFQVIVEASYAQTQLLIPTGIIPVGLNVNENPPGPAPFTKDAMEYGMKVSFQKSDYDLSLSAFKGFAAIPEFILNRSTGAINATNEPERAVGGDASFTYGNYIVRLESAVHLPDNGGANDPYFGYVEPDHWDSVLGIEKPFLTDFRAQVQFLYRYHLSFPNQVVSNTGSPQLNAVLNGIAAANATLLNYQHQGNPGATFRVAFARDSSDWTAEVFFVGYFAFGRDYLFRPQVGYKWSENFKLLAGMDIYGGDPNRPLGSLHSDSDAFFEAKTFF